MLRSTQKHFGSLRYRRPYWMLFLSGVDNWKIYTVIRQPTHQRTEMLYQAWLGGLDRPYVRPRCMARQPLWLEKKRHALKVPALQGPETSLEKYYLDWDAKFFSFQGTVVPTVEDLHIAFDLVETHLDLSYAVRILGHCRLINNIAFADETFMIFLEACLRVGRKDVAVAAMEEAEKLGFRYIDDNCRKYLEGKQTWYRRSLTDGLYYPPAENEELNANIGTQEQQQQRQKEGVTAETAVAEEGAKDGEAMSPEELQKQLEEEEQLLQELEELEKEEKSIADSQKKS